MNFHGYRRPRPDIDLSALVDVLFILIVFVILVANFDRVTALDVTLPAADAEQSPADDVVRLVIPAIGPARLAGAAVPPDQLAGRLAAARAGSDRLLVIADGRIPLTRVTAALDAARRAGFVDVAIATRPGAGP